MIPRVVIKTIRNFYCPAVEAEVHLEYCTDLKYQVGQASDIREVLINPDCEQKDQCGIASQQAGKTTYDWSRCAHQELQTAVCQQDGEKREWGLG